MKKFLSVISILSGLLMLVLAGCELTTTPAGPPRGKVPGNDLVLNELYTISPDKYYAYSWIELFNPTDHPIPWVDDVFPVRAYAIGGNGAFVYSEEVDRGLWSTINLGTTQSFNALDFYYPDTAFACGDGGVVMKLRGDGTGAYATQVLPTGTTTNINDIAFIYQNAVGYFVGDGGLIKRSVNAGNAWTTQTSGVTKSLRAIAFVEFGGANRIWIVGDSGTVLKKGAGVSWTKQSVPSDKQTTNFYGLSMATDTGFVVGEGGTVLFTKSAGANWASKSSGVSTTLRTAFYSSDVNHFVYGRAWLAGDNGVILRTNDYGDTWTRQTSGTTARLNRIIFSDSIRGVAFGDGGTIVNTVDGGNTWNVQNSHTSENLRGASTLPLTITVENYYVMEMYAKRKTFYVDPISGRINFDYFTKIDTGLVVYDPQTLFFFGFPLPKAIQPYGFIILNSDSSRFKDHIKLGPGQSQLLNLSIGFQQDTVLHPVLWDLLASGEVRLVKYYVKRTTGSSNSIFLGFEKKVVEIIRYGGFKPTTAIYPADQLFLNNEPLGFIPEGYSIARYANDGGGLLPSEQSTAYSFYMAQDPIPGWFSQESRK